MYIYICTYIYIYEAMNPKKTLVKSRSLALQHPSVARWWEVRAVFGKLGSREARLVLSRVPLYDSRSVW